MDVHYFLNGPSILFFEDPVSILSLKEASTPSQAFTLNCTSTGSPATIVTWARNGESLSTDDGTYQNVQILTDAISATYDNLLIIHGQPDDIVGEYRCSVENAINTPTSETSNFEGWF